MYSFKSVFRIFGLTLLSGALLMFPNCISDDISGTADCTNGSGNVISSDFELEPFQNIDFNGVGNIILKKGSSFLLELQIDDNLVELVDFEVDDGTLELRLLNCVNSAAALNFTVTVPELRNITIDGSGALVSDSSFVWQSNTLDLTLIGAWNIVISKIETETFNVDGIGASVLDIGGEATRQNLELEGSIEYNGFDLQSQFADLDLAGTHVVEVSVSDSLTVETEGTVSVFYMGDPVIEAELSETSTLTDAN